jgi:lactoylglutathione lyase
MITNIATAAGYVENPNDAVSFWTEKVGFVVHREKRMTAEASWIEVGPKGAQSCLVIFPKAMMANCNERKPSIVSDCNSVRDTYKEMNTRGVKFSQAPQAMGWGTLAIFTDPEGNSFGLREPDK